MIAVDTNILVYSHREESAWHADALARVTALAEGAAAWAIPWPCLHEFLSIVTEEYRGSDSYRAASLSVEKRFSKGASLTASYTRSRLRDKLNMLNPANGVLEDRVSPNGICCSARHTFH